MYDLSLISKMDAASLEELDSKQLLDRFDEKYIFHIDLFPELFKYILNDYKILEINDIREFAYLSRYYDTPDLRLHTDHVNGKGNRLKIRARSYLDTDTQFFEIKFKNNKKKTSKSRIVIGDVYDTLATDAKSLVENQTNIKADDISPVLNIHFKRVTLIHKHHPEKITFDTALDFDNGSNQKTLNGLVIAERKHDKSGFKSEFVEFMNISKISPSSISKYCTGIIYTTPEAKYNRLKKSILAIEKIINTGK